MHRIEECIEKLKNVITPIEEAEEKELLSAVGKTAAKDIYSEIDIPEFPKSAMDGYAVRAEEVAAADSEHPVSLKVIGELSAGDRKDFPYEKNTAVRIMTGAYVPEGYDAVVKQEDTESKWDEKDGSSDAADIYVKIYKGVKPYMNYCKKGEDLQKGDLILPKGKNVTPLDTALLAGAGIDRILVKRSLKVSILSTGSELTEPGKELAPGAIYQNISFYLSALMQRKGINVVSAGICRDEKAVIKDKLKSLCEVSDVVITTGGVSVGKKDFLPDTLSDMGAEILFRGADIQPGTPTMAAVINTDMGEKKLILCLSGNPYAAFTNFEIYFWNMAHFYMPYVQKEKMLPYRTIAVFRGQYDKKNFHRRYIRAYYKNGEVMIPSERHMSSVISNLHECNAFIDLESNRSLKDGDFVHVQLFSDSETFAVNNKVISGGVVTGGKSSRMGQDKSGLTYKGRTFLENTLLKMQEAGLADIMVSCASSSEELTTGSGSETVQINTNDNGCDTTHINENDIVFRKVYDEHSDRGPLEGIRCLINASETEWVFVTAVDMQKTDAEMIRYLSQFALPEYDAVCFTGNDRINPLFALYNKSIMPFINAAVDKGNYRLRDVLSAANTLYLDAEKAGYGDALSNINTPKDYERLTMPGIITVCGVKNSGKTTLIEGLVKRFFDDGIKAGVIKHDGHEYDEDISATDTGRVLENGAFLSAVYSSTKHTLYGCKTDIKNICRYMGKSDIIIAEGHKDSFLPKIEVVRNEISSDLVSSGSEPFIIATDNAALLSDKRAVHIDDIDEIYKRIKEYYK